MSIIGTWKVKKVGVFSMEEGMVMKSVEDLAKMEPAEDYEDALQMAQAILKVTDGTMRMCVAVPPEVIEEAKAAGEEMPINDDGTMTMDEYAWKEEAGQFFYATGDEGEINGEAIDPWTPVEFDADGLLVLGIMAFGKE